jgi:hypothetical protein
MQLAEAADYQPSSKFVLRENRELISLDDLKEFHEENPQKDQLCSAEDFFGIATKHNN